MSVCGNNVKFGRRKGNIDDEEEEEDIEYTKQVPKKEFTEVHDGKSDTSIWKGPDSSISYLDFNEGHSDLRQKLNDNREKITPIQCRLKAPNNFANRPRGIPTLLPLDSYTNKNNNRNGFRRPKGNQGGFNASPRNLDGVKNFRQSYNGVGMNGVSNGRVQRNRRQDTDRYYF